MRVCFILWCLAVSSAFVVNTVFASTVSTLQYGTRFHYLATQSDQMGYHAIFHFPLSPKFETELGGRLCFVNFWFARIDYKGEIKFYPVKPVFLGFRLSHSVFTREEISHTTALIQSGFRVPLFPWLSTFGSLGWHESFTQLKSALPIPFAVGSDLRDHDLTLEFGLRVSPAQKWSADFALSTQDEIDVFRLNNPYVKISVNHELNPAFSLQGYVRYRILLGFGRLDEFVAGFGFTTSLGTTKEP